MIFKTIEDEAARSGLRIQNTFSQAFSAIRSNQGFSFSTNYASTLNADTIALNQYQAALQAGVPQAQAFANTMTMASQTAQNFALSTDMLTANTSQYLSVAAAQDVTLQASNRSLGNVKTLINEYNGGLKTCGLSQKQFVDAVGKSNVGLSTYLSGLNGANASLGGYIASLIKTKVATVALQAATMAMNMALTMGISALVSVGIKAISNLVDSLHQSRDELKESANEIRDSYSSASEQISSDLNTISSLESEFNRLSKGVSTYGENISLTSDEYERYKEIVAQIVATNPALVDGYNSEGDAIANKNTLLEESIALLKEKQRLELQEYISDDALKTTGMDAVEDINDYKDENPLPYGDAKWDFGTRFAEAAARYDSENQFENNYDLFKALSPEGYDWSDYGLDNLYAKNFGQEYFEAIVEDLRSEESILKDYLTSDEIGDLLNIANSYDQNLASYNSRMDAYSKALNPTLQLVAQAEESYSSLSDAQKSFISSYINGFEITGDTTEEEILNMKYQIQDFVNAIADNEGAGKYIDELMSLNVTEFDSVDAYISKINSLADSISSMEGIDMTSDEILGSLGMGNLENILDDDFSSSVDTYIGKTKELNSALEKFRNGDFTNDDLKELTNTFPELADQSDNLDNAIIQLMASLDNDMMSGFNSQFGNLDSKEDIAALQNFEAAVLSLGSVVGNTAFSIDIATETDGMEKLFTAMKESVTSTGLTSESISSLKTRYQELEDYDAARLFEKTANGVHLNTKALRELETAYEEQQKVAIDDELKYLEAQYNNLTKEINNTSDAATRAELYAKRNDILSQIEDTAMLAAQYEGLTSAFYKWEQAQSIGEEGDMYDSLAGGLENIKQLYDDGLVGTNKFRTAVQLMSNEDLSNASIEQLMAAYESGYSKMTRYFQDSSDGCLNFLNDVQELNSEWAHMNEDGSWEINFGTGNDQEIADALGINVESVQAILRKLSDYGFDINLDSMYSSLDMLKSEAEEANDKLKELGKTDYTFNFNTDDLDVLDEEIKAATETLEQFRNEDGTVNLELEGAEEAQGILATLIYQKQSLDKSAILSVDTSNASSEIETVIGKLQEFKSSYNTLEVQTAVGADTSQAEADIDAALASMSSEHAEILASLGIDTSSADAAIASINALTPEVMVKCGLDASLVEGYQAAEHTANGEVIWDNNIAKVTAWANQTHKSNGTVEWGNDTTKVKTYFTATGTVKWNNGAGAAGTAHAQGTAKARGDWGTKESGVALGGELGQELVVRDGKFFTIGDKSAEFFQYKKGDIIFNAAQTEEIFRKGKISSGSPRGRLFAEGTAFSGGSGTIYGKGTVTTTPSGSGNSNNNNNSNNSNSNSDADEPEVIDWIEVAIERLERAIKNLEITATSAYKTLKERLGATSSQISKVNEEIALQQKAYNRYMQEANSVGLSSELQAKVKNGTIDINEYDDATAELIKEYQEWYEKALDCSDAINELHENLGSLYEDNFNNIATDFENQLAMLEHLTNSYENDIDMLEAKGYLGSAKYYEELKNIEKQNISVLEQELVALTTAMSDAVNSGEIAVGSEAWYEMQQEINDTKEAIDEANISIIELNNSIRELDWEVFDYLQERISTITNEAEFLIDLMSTSDLYTDKGQLTDTGMATMGLHGVNYNTYMAQADEYAKEIAQINQDLANDPNNTKLIERKEELLELQRESILAAEDEKQAIIDMVEEGIQLELDSLKELIDAYTDSLDSAKDLYDYQKKIKKQTDTISSIQKQISAYKGDTSEENRARLQKLEVDLSDAMEDLQETEYDHYISEQKKMMDNLYTEYELILNQRLDNIDALIADMISSINLNADTIKTTLETQSANVGYTMTEAFNNIWTLASEQMKIDAANRVTDTTNIINQLVANGVLAQEDANKIITALGTGDAQGITNATNIINELVAQGALSQTDATSIKDTINTSGNSYKGVITTYGNDFQGKATTTNTILDNIKQNVANMVAESNKQASTTVSSTTPTTPPASKPSSPSNKNTNTSSNTSSQSNTSSGDGTPRVGDKVTFQSGRYYYSSDGATPTGSKNLGREVYITKINTASWATKKYHISTGNKLGSGDLGWVSLDQLKGYSTGGIIDYDGLAMVHGGKKPELVLNAQDTENFIALKDALRSMAENNISLGNLNRSNSIIPHNAINLLPEIQSGMSLSDYLSRIASNPGNAQSVNVGDVKYEINIPIDHVDDYNDLVNKLRQDPRFGKLIESMTIERFVGGSQFSKNKYKW